MHIGARWENRGRSGELRRVLKPGKSNEEMNKYKLTEFEDADHAE